MSIGSKYPPAEPGIYLTSIKVRINLILEPIPEFEPIHISSYCLGDIEIKMVKVNDAYVVLQLNKKEKTGKSILCLGYEHADYVMEGCINQILPWIN